MTHPIQQSKKLKRVRALNRRLVTINRQRNAIERELDRLHHHAGIRPRDKPRVAVATTAEQQPIWGKPSLSLFTEKY